MYNVGCAEKVGGRHGGRPSSFNQMSVLALLEGQAPSRPHNGRLFQRNLHCTLFLSSTFKSAENAAEFPPQPLVGLQLDAQESLFVRLSRPLPYAQTDR